MSSDSYRAQFARHGYVLLPGVLSATEIDNLRKVLDGVFSTQYPPSKRLLLPSETLRIPEVCLLPFKAAIVEALKQITGGAYAMLANFNVQRNQFGGWHCDADSEGNARYLRKNGYTFIKCGIYLQDESADWGGTIQVVAGGHRFPCKFPSDALTFKVKRIWNRLGQKFFSTSPGIRAGDFVAFDYRLPHSATWPRPANRGQTVDGTMAGIPPDRTKYVVYWDVGSPQCASAYLQHMAGRARREELSGQSIEPFFSDYLRLKFPEDYPPGFAAAVEACGIHNASLDADGVREWKQKYDEFTRQKSMH